MEQKLSDHTGTYQCTKCSKTYIVAQDNPIPICCNSYMIPIW